MADWDCGGDGQPPPTHRRRSCCSRRSDALDLDAGAERLRQKHEKLRAQLAGMTRISSPRFAASTDSAIDDEHDPEGQTIAHERSHCSAILQGAPAHLDGIDAAAATGSVRCPICDMPRPAEEWRLGQSGRAMCLEGVAEAAVVAVYCEGKR